MATMVVSLRAADQEMKLVYLGQRRSPLEHLTDWTHSAIGPIEIDALALSLIDRLADDDRTRWTFVLEGVGELLNTDCDLSLQDLLKAARANDHFVIAEGETSTLTGSWPLLQAVKVSRLGIALQPDQADGDTLFKTSFPRLARGFPPGPWPLRRWWQGQEGPGRTAGVIGDFSPFHSFTPFSIFNQQAGTTGHYREETAMSNFTGMDIAAVRQLSTQLNAKAARSATSRSN